MKSIKSFSIAAALTLTSLSGYSNDLIKGPENFRDRVMNILKSSNLSSEKFVVNFLVNNKSEIIVVSTTSEANENAVKNLLNYQKVDVEGLKPNVIYTLPITIIGK